MSLTSAFRYGIRGLVSAAAGAAEGAVAAATAEDARSHRDMQLKHQQRLADLEEFRIIADTNFKQAALAEESRQFDKADKTKRMEIRVTKEGKLYEVDAQTGVAKFLGELEAESKKEVAEIGAQATTGAATIKADADKAVAETQAGAVKSTNESRERIADEDRAMSYEIEELRAQTQVYEADIRREIAEKGYASAEKVAQWTLANEAYKAELDAGGGAAAGGTVEGLGLNPDQIKRVDALANDYRLEKDYQALQKMQSEYDNAVKTYNRISEESKEKGENVETGVGDIALINIFQRFIDPGVSVREGDVDLLQKAEALTSTLELWRGKITAGAKLTPDSRRDMFQLVTDFYTTAMARKGAELTSRYTNRIGFDALLKNSGVEVKHLGTDYASVYQAWLDAQKTPSEAAEGDGDPNTPVPGLTEPGGAQGAADTTPLGVPGSEKRARSVDSAARYAIEQGWTEEQVQAAALARPGSDEDFVIRVLERWRAMRPLEGDAGDEEEGDNRNSQDFRNRGKKEDDDADE